eukprot:CAMPEP_0173391506 /NCGR_PEP_ID=MMETSP1356-20130122/18422_1 /TAXON_ID=77927 ORGANISM="Hemiselmis virescens, Strain PCC157" /NCGR_SAMPLE_ID=MMETSP1356 /ASSEMBLY_ACC=CAM_ASM_000847 /LENGTH=147 /DNA_ID=CAMNT_0014349149 /DNA_START=365 /DNA_END=806 /DNA_ORIENTATION=-
MSVGVISPSTPDVWCSDIGSGGERGEVNDTMLLGEDPSEEGTEHDRSTSPLRKDPGVAGRRREVGRMRCGSRAASCIITGFSLSRECSPSEGVMGGRFAETSIPRGITRPFFPIRAGGVHWRPNTPIFLSRTAEFAATCGKILTAVE